MINKILFITLSNIGDCILTLPVLDALKKNFPEAAVTVVAGPRLKEIFQDNPNISKVIIFDKHSGLKEKRRLFSELMRERFDMVVDLRNSFLGAIIRGKYKISPFTLIPQRLEHMKERHIFRLSTIYPSIVTADIQNKSLYIKPEDEQYIKGILKENNISAHDKIIVVSPGARSHTKRWPQEKFAELIPFLISEFGAKIVLVGDKEDVPITRYIAQHVPYPVADLAGKTSIAQLAALLKKSGLVITNDSAVLHLASYLDVRLLAIFGPTSEIKYGPWSDAYSIAKKDIFCRPCEKAQCKFGTLKCMQMVRAEGVLHEVRNLLAVSPKAKAPQQVPDFKRILIVRTDRIGDVLLSTPVIKAFRDNYPHAYIAMMVSPYGKNIVEDNPYLDEVLPYDKGGKHKSWLGSFKFAQKLREKKFDVAVILHPTNRVHLVTFFSGIPRRIGYDRKCGFLLTDKIKHTKHLGEKHESEYALDLVRHLGIEPRDKMLFMPLKQESERWVEELFRQEGIKKTDKLLAIHPGASCPSKIWPNQRFAEVADRLIKKYGFKVLLIAGPKDLALADSVIKNMHHTAINLSGKTSISQLASLLKRCSLFISNDSGPVHIACAVGTPVISIFGRSQRGLSPVRWGPTGDKAKAVYKTVGCIECLAHNCVKELACLRAITPDEIIAVADLILKG